MSIQKTGYYQSPIGLITIKVTDQYISCISFKEEQIIVHETHPIIQETINQLQQYFNSERKEFDLPLNQNGTEFQQRVWSELSKIPFGKTISYLELSKKIGDVKAIRAVGTSNGKNQIAIIVPCHRVIGTDGSLTGYAGGLWRKQWLLELENNLIAQQLKMF